ncbi:family 20 glycosylhydrolase [Dyella sp. A6]|uniref:glycoside hydrolase family 20 protein n=1 Tax=Dyella aluminiiresistens TaxID=3069105 RepID=UPI002E772A59|nr:family 20 glycosylhydrolase [Dyella sp. A6]
MSKLFWAMCVQALLIVSATCMATGVDILPRPQHLTMEAGHFRLAAGTSLQVHGDARTHEVASFLRKAVRAQVGIDLVRGRHPGRIVLRLDASIRGDEAYRLTIDPAGVVIAASTDKGLFWGVQTFRQLLPPHAHAPVELPSLRIDDAPAYPYRGVMLDVSRHFYPVSFIEKQLDLLSYYKINTFHWHLTDDQGWRIQMPRYPKLTRIGAWRTESDGTRYGGYYTTAQIRAVVAYARQRNITVIPEIEMPGHSSAALVAYPELACGKPPRMVPTSWGVFDSIDCVGKPGTFVFLRRVLDEVTSLFPSPYVHIGGDEVPKDQWHDCASCQRLMHAQGLKNEDGLQSYFIRRIQRDLERRGKTLMGWDEILEGGADTHAIIESWRGPDEEAKALRNGNRVVVAGPFYLDRPLDTLTTQDVYRIDIASDTRSATATQRQVNDAVFRAHRAQILGGEAPLWSEHANPRNAESKLYPRLLAFAENLWSGGGRGDRAWTDFQQRLQAQYPRLDAWRVAYGPQDQPVVSYAIAELPDGGGWRLDARRGFADLVNHYTLDGRTPIAASPAFTDTVVLHRAGMLKVVPFRHGMPYDNPVRFQLLDSLAVGKPITFAQPASAPYAPGRVLVDGVLGSNDFHDGRWAAWHNDDLDATIDLGRVMPVHEIRTRFMQAVGSRILPPQRLRFMASDDGRHWHTLLTEQPGADLSSRRTVIYRFAYRPRRPFAARYLRLAADRYTDATLPSGFPGGAADIWLFADEIVVK